MNMIKFLILVNMLLLGHFSDSKDALQYFVHHQKLHNFSITILNESDVDSTKRWIEYKYYFNKTEDSKKDNFYNGTILSKTVNGKLTELRVGFVKKKNNDFDCNCDNSSVLNDSVELSIKGYSIDLINFLKSSLNISVVYTPVINVEVLQKLLLENEIDIVICHPFIDHENIVQLYPTIKSKYILIYKPSKLYFTKDIFVLTFAGSLWFVLLITLIVLAICLRIATVKYSMIYQNHEAWTWVEITFWAIAAACQQGLSRTPDGFTSRCIFFMGYLTAYLLYTGFAAAITSVLVQYDYYKLDVSNLKSTKFQLISLKEFQHDTATISKNFKHTTYVQDMTSFFAKLEEYNTVGIAPDILINQFVVNNFDYRKISAFLTLKLMKIKYNRGFYVLHNSSFKKIITKQISKMDERGILKNVLRKNLKTVLTPDLQFGYSSASFDHVGSAVFLLLTGILISLMFLLSECAIACYKRNYQKIGL